MIINKFRYFYKYKSPGIPGSVIKNLIYKISWRLNLVESPSMGKYKTYILNRKMWSDVFDNR